MKKRVGVFGWGIVAPRARNVEAFAQNLDSTASHLTAFDGFGPSPFLVGEPDFDFADYREWIDARFPPNRFPQLHKKFGTPTHYAVASFIQALGQNPGLEAELQQLGTAAHIYLGGGLHDIPTYYEEGLALARAQRRWNRFWSQPQHNSAYEDFIATPAAARADGTDLPPDPAQLSGDDADDARDAWWAYWAGRSPQLKEYLREYCDIESLDIVGEVESAKAAVIKQKRSRTQELQRRWQAPDPPWNIVSPNVLWNIGSIAASQVSMLGKITGMTFAPFAACSSFSYSLKLGMDAIRSGDATAVVVGAADPKPHPLSVGTFFGARVLSADGVVSKPLTGLRGTHVAGGAAVWIIGDLEYFTRKGFRPLGMEPLSVGVSSDAHHIITPSAEGPYAAMRMALAAAGIDGAEIKTWDLHATATPGDYLEVQNARRVVGADTCMTARKGSLGHGMGAAGGWELTAQYLGYERGHLYGTPLKSEELNREIARVHLEFAFEGNDTAAHGPAGKLSMGVGGINACVISRPLVR
ncbi:MAG: beta-ketoacyl synthase N-terminal-like domain-containing protein [Planctomycetota bacterium]